MHIFDSAIVPYFFLPEKDEGHLLNQAIHESLSTCLAFGSTSNNHYTLINTPSFCQALISYIGFDRLLLESYPADNEVQGVLARQFRELKQWIKGIHIKSFQESKGSVFADACGSQEGIDLFLFSTTPNDQIPFNGSWLDSNLCVRHLLLGSNSPFSIKIPEDIKAIANTVRRFPPVRSDPHVVCSKDVIAINRGTDSIVFCFSKDQRTFQKHYEVENTIMELIIREDNLYIREWTKDKNEEKIFIGNLNSSDSSLREISIPHFSRCPSKKYAFGLEYLVVMDDKQLMAIPLVLLIAAPLVSLTDWIRDEQPHHFTYIFPYEQDFIGIVEKKDHKIDIVKIKVLENQFQTEFVKEDIHMSGLIATANLHLGRLFFACENFMDSTTEIYSYYLETNKLQSLLFSVGRRELEFKPRFIWSAKKMNYLVITPSHFPITFDPKSYLTSFDYNYQLSNSPSSDSTHTSLKREQQNQEENQRPKKKAKN